MFLKPHELLCHHWSAAGGWWSHRSSGPDVTTVSPDPLPEGPGPQNPDTQNQTEQRAFHHVCDRHHLCVFSFRKCSGFENTVTWSNSLLHKSQSVVASDLWPVLCVFQTASGRRVSDTEPRHWPRPLPPSTRVRRSVSTCPPATATARTNPCSVTPASASAGAWTRRDRRFPAPEPNRAADPCVRTFTEYHKNNLYLIITVFTWLLHFKLYWIQYNTSPSLFP